MPTPLLILPMALPAVGGLIVFHLHHKGARQAFITILLIVEAILAIALSALCRGDAMTALVLSSNNLAIQFRADTMSTFFVSIVSVVWVLAGIFAFEYMEHEQHHERFFCFYLLTEAAIITICLSANLATLYLAYEAMTLLSVPLVIHTGTKEANAAGIKYLGFSCCGAGMGLFGLFVLNGFCGTQLFTPGGCLDAAAVSGHSTLLLVAYLIMMIGFGCKAGMFPMHAWLPTAHPVAPAPASAVLSGIITKMGVLAIIRVTYYLYGPAFLKGSWAQTALLVLALITVFMGSMLAYKEKVLKKRLAYSTVSQVSYVLFGLFLMHPVAFVGALLQILFHAAAKNGLFLSAGAIIAKTGNTLVTQLRGMGKQMPVVMWCFTITALSLIGIPPTGGFIAKWYLAEGALTAAGVFGFIGVIVLLISAILTAGYLLPIVAQSFFPGDKFDYGSLKKAEPSWKMLIPLIVLAAAVLVIGFYPAPVHSVISTVAATLF